MDDTLNDGDNDGDNEYYAMIRAYYGMIRIFAGIFRNYIQSFLSGSFFYCGPVFNVVDLSKRKAKTGHKFERNASISSTTILTRTSSLLM